MCSSGAGVVVFGVWSYFGKKGGAWYTTGSGAVALCLSLVACGVWGLATMPLISLLRSTWTCGAGAALIKIARTDTSMGKTETDQHPHRLRELTRTEPNEHSARAPVI